MADATYSPLVYHAQGGAQIVVASGGSVKLETGGKILPNSGTQAAVLANLATGATLANVIARCNAISAAITNVGILATS